MYKSFGLIEQHFHGVFGIDFSNCSVNDFVDVSVEILKYGITRIYPTLMTDDLGKIKSQISKIKKAKEIQPVQSAKISGIHLEGPFINPEKSGIHNPEFILTPSIENYSKIEDDFIKIVTVAPEFDTGLCQYLKQKGVKVSAGHTTASDLSGCDCATHLFNAMSGITHKAENTVTSALVNDDLFVEVIADGNHIIPAVLDLIFRAKPHDKIILISDALPCTYADKSEFVFAGQKVFYKNGAFYNSEGILGGSGMLVSEIIKKLVNTRKFSLSPETLLKMASKNILKYLNVENNGFVYFDENLNVIKTELLPK